MDCLIEEEGNGGVAEDYHSQGQNELDHQQNYPIGFPQILICAPILEAKLAAIILQTE